MPQYAKIYHDLGYNVLMPDARGHGKSEGDYIALAGQNEKTIFNGSIESSSKILNQKSSFMVLVWEEQRL